MFTRFCQLLTVLLLFCTNLLAQQIQHINPPTLAASKGYTQVVVAQGGRTVYISGQVSANSKGEIMHKSDFRAQTRQVFENMKTALAAVGATFADVVKTTTYVVGTDAEKIGIVREVRNQYYTSPNPPASTYVGVQALYDSDVLIEIEAIAVVK
ncbi:RidA family protein [Spirosoma soli]|uniref:RidA family protein n=1 Tax=Spirosoma soli TaxID=1770529 RepID=A0ABW5M135_9BACT